MNQPRQPKGLVSDNFFLLRRRRTHEITTRLRLAGPLAPPYLVDALPVVRLSPDAHKRIPAETWSPRNMRRCGGQAWEKAGLRRKNFLGYFSPERPSRLEINNGRWDYCHKKSSSSSETCATTYLCLRAAWTAQFGRRPAERQQGRQRRRRSFHFRDLSKSFLSPTPPDCRLTELRHHWIAANNPPSRQNGAEPSALLTCTCSDTPPAPALALSHISPHHHRPCAATVPRIHSKRHKITLPPGPI